MTSYHAEYLGLYQTFLFGHWFFCGRKIRSTLLLPQDSSGTQVDLSWSNGAESWVPGVQQ